MKLKNVLTIIFSTILLTLFTQNVSAVEDLYENFDNSLVAGLEYQYSEPTQILFTQIEGQYDSINLSTQEFINTIYYYSITKLKLGNIPLHYAIDENGEVFKTQNYDGIKLTDQQYIVIGYLSNNPQVSNKAKESFLDLSNDLSYAYGIKQFDVRKYGINQDVNGISTLSLIEPNSLFTTSVEETLQDWETSSRDHGEYSVEIVEVQSADSVEIGSRLEVKVNIKNTGEEILFSDTNPVYISVKDSKESPYAVNGDWDSFSKPVSIASDRFVLPGETIELTFQLDPKVIPGDNSETFEILKYEKEPFVNSEFKVSFKVEKGDNIIIKIYSPEYGFVNIRKCTGYNCEKIEVANDGEVYIVKKQEDLWYEIQIEEGLTGWVYAKYVREL